MLEQFLFSLRCESSNSNNIMMLEDTGVNNAKQLGKILHHIEYSKPFRPPDLLFSAMFYCLNAGRKKVI